MREHKQKIISSQGEGTPLPPELAGGGEATSLLYLYSNNSIETSPKKLSSASEILTPYHKKQAHALAENVQQFCRLNEIEKVGFLTLTFMDNVKDHKEAQRRFNSLSSNCLREMFSAYMLVKERQKRGAWHYHLLVACNADIRTGLNFEECFPEKGRGNYRSASPYLRSLWRDLRAAMKRYKFGRSELAPIRSTDEGIARYVGKYIQQNAIGKNESGFNDKGIRVVSYSTKWPRTTMAFSWNTPGAKNWRRQVKRFATEYLGVKSYEELSLKLGKRWAYHFADVIYDIDLILEDIKDKKEALWGKYKLSEDGILTDSETGEMLF